ncbi:mitochondrial inner membrane magnesium transporter Mfm1p [[Candida] anglica]|uniref:Magnesium transporter n=1 Tax=[Candida] anglica TaxID=148631 RepID=A0ABP0EIG7_9ASCO
MWRQVRNSQRICRTFLNLEKRQYSGKGAGGDSFHDLFLTKSLASNNKSTDSYPIRCTIFDGTGKMIAHGKDFTRSEFIKAHDLIPRDFRKLNRYHHGVAAGTGTSVDMVPSILTRANSVLLNISNVRSLIKSDTVVIFDEGSSGINESHSHGTFLKDMQKRLQEEHSEHEMLPYEFRALECILVHVTSNLTTEMKVHQTVLQNILLGLESSIERVKLRYLLIQSKKITQFHQKAKLIRDLLDDLLEQDDELNELYLTAKAQGNPRFGTNHAEVEMLIESYYKTADEIVQTVENLLSQIKTTEEIINIVLDSNRNELMLLGLKFSVGLLSMGTILWVAALYGMNLENFIEEKDGGFEVVVTAGCIMFGFLLLYSVKRLARLQRITMTGVVKHDRR